MLILLMNGEGFTFAMFVSGAFATAIPGIIIQLILIPALMVVLNRARLVSLGDETNA